MSRPETRTSRPTFRLRSAMTRRSGGGAACPAACAVRAMTATSARLPLGSQNVVQVFIDRSGPISLSGYVRRQPPLREYADRHGPFGSLVDHHAPQLAVAEKRHPLLGDEHPSQGVLLGDRVYLEPGGEHGLTRGGGHGGERRTIELHLSSIERHRAHPAGARARRTDDGQCRKAESVVAVTGHRPTRVRAAGQAVVKELPGPAA